MRPSTDRPTERPPGDARALIDAGLRYEQGGSPDRAIAQYEAALALATDDVVRAEALVRVSSVHRARCDWDHATEAARRSAAVAESAGLDAALAEAINAEAIVYQMRGDFAAAVPLLERIPAITADERVRGLAAQNLGTIAARRGDFALAEHHFLASVEHFRRAGYAWGEAVALVNAAAVALDQRHWTMAHDVATTAREAALRVGDQELLGIATLNLAEADFHLGDLERAESGASEALGHFRVSANLLREAECLRLLGDVATGRGHEDVARRCWERGLALARKTGAELEAGQLEERLARAGE